MSKKKIIFKFLLVILWMIVIFMFSHQNATESSSTSSKAIELLQIIFQKDFTQSTIISSLQFIVRKCAHMICFGLLGILSYNAFVEIKYKRAYTYAGLLSISYACFDEVHQLFIEGRAGQIQDVLIDSVGICVGFILIYIFKLIKNKF